MTSDRFRQSRKAPADNEGKPPRSFQTTKESPRDAEVFTRRSRASRHDAASRQSTIDWAQGSIAQGQGSRAHEAGRAGRDLPRSGAADVSRKLKRVPIAFDWPLNQVWGGY